ncbi:hypothetical protein ACXR2U_13480 [Jatrophihabitans sp. YIM 134969]
MDTAPDPRPDLTAAQRIAIALGTAENPLTDPSPPAAGMHAAAGPAVSAPAVAVDDPARDAPA